MKSWYLVRRSLGLLSRRDRLILGLAAGVQTLVAFLDLLAVVMFGVVASVAASQEGLGTTGTSSFTRLLPVEDVPLVALAGIAGIALIGKSLVSLLLTRRIYRFIANRQAIVAGALAQKLLTGSILDVQARPSQQTAFALTAGVNAATVNTLGPAMVVGAEMSLVVILAAGLLLVDPLVAIFTTVFFALLAGVLQLALGRWAHSIGAREQKSSVASTEVLQQSIRAFREISVTGRRQLFIDGFVTARWESARVKADEFILSQAGKYVFEVGLVLGGSLLVLLLVQTREVAAAVAVLTVFLVAASRLVPSLLRLQTAFATIRNSAGLADQTFALVSELPDTVTRKSAERIEAREFHIAAAKGYPGFDATVRLDHVWLSYPSVSTPTLCDVSLDLAAGKYVALVGASGAGKSTLADVILGVLQPTFGSARVSGVPAHEASRGWPGAMAYVPQDVAVLSGTVRSNVAIGFPREDVDDEWVWQALRRAHLADFLLGSRDGLDTVVGENGVKLSGGQRQRLGLARALYSKPRLLVLDEATSALDAQTEHEISQALGEISTDTTLIVIAHRLATVRDADTVIYLHAGKVAASGSFDEVRVAIPEFDSQARLLGL